jgi:hypothetical protein
VVGQLTHVSQVMTGFAMLDNARRIDATFDFASPSTNAQPTDIVIVTIGNRVRVAYDVGDGDPVYPDVLNKVDLYFKRSFRRGSDARVQPFGLHYPVTWAGDPLERHIGLPTVEQVEDVPRESAMPRVVFMTRLWNPHGEADEDSSRFDEQFVAERREINRMRVDCIRALHERFADAFVGGLRLTEYAQRHHPDLVLAPGETSRAHYLRAMHGCDIGISTRGLHRSNPSKLGEYVAASKAVVTEPLAFHVPELVDGLHYLTFRTAGECVARVEELLADPALVHEMQARNQRFYQAHLRPDRLIDRTITLAARWRPTTPR